MLDLPPTHYQRAVLAVQAYIATEAALPLQPGSGSRLLAHADTPPRGTLVMYHGFTAGTWQYDLLAQAAYREGWNVFVPRLPGHGLRDARGVEDPSGLIPAAGWKAYDRFGDETAALAAGMGGPVGLLGLSVGANVAAAVAERNPAVDRVVAYAPFLWPQDGRVQAAFRINHALGGLLDPLLDRYTYSWGEESRRQTLTGVRPGHSYFTGGSAYAATELGREAIAHAPGTKVPMQLFTTQADDAAEPGAIGSLFDAWGGPKARYDYPLAEGIPHPMLHPMEDKGKGQTPALYAMTLAFLKSGIPLSR